MNEDKVMRHKELCNGLNALYARKNHDYGDSFHQTFVEEGLSMARIRLGDKFSRFKTLSRISPTGSTQQQITDESIRDTLLDLANYAIMTVLELDEIISPQLLSLCSESRHEIHSIKTGERKQRKPPAAETTQKAMEMLECGSTEKQIEQELGLTKYRIRRIKEDLKKRGDNHV